MAIRGRRRGTRLLPGRAPGADGVRRRHRHRVRSASSQEEAAQRQDHPDPERRMLVDEAAGRGRWAYPCPTGPVGQEREERFPIHLNSRTSDDWMRWKSSITVGMLTPSWRRSPWAIRLRQPRVGARSEARNRNFDMAVSRSEALAGRRATYQDVLDAPAHQIAQIIDGTLHTHSRPAVPHTRASSVLGRKIGAPYDDDATGPDGWWVLDGPELHLGEDILVPDLAGWRRERMPELPDAAYVTVAPDWVCEVLSGIDAPCRPPGEAPDLRARRRGPPLAHRSNRPDARGVRAPRRRVGAHRVCEGRRAGQRPPLRRDHVQPRQTFGHDRRPTRPALPRCRAEARRSGVCEAASQGGARGRMVRERRTGVLGEPAWRQAGLLLRAEAQRCDIEAAESRAPNRGSRPCRSRPNSALPHPGGRLPRSEVRNPPYASAPPETGSRSLGPRHSRHPAGTPPAATRAVAQRDMRPATGA